MTPTDGQRRPRLGWFSAAVFRHHRNAAYHPENHRRLEVIEATVGSTHPGLLQQTPTPCPRDALYRAHDREYVDLLFRKTPATGLRSLDPDTSLSPATMDAVLLACGSLIAATTQVMGANGLYTKAFCAVRPPGHHAEYDRAMGFCVINHIAVASLHLLSTGAVERIAVIDFDVHHGNGSENIFSGNEQILFCSTYEDGIFPIGTRPGRHGNIVNVPLPHECDGDAYFRHFDETIVPAVHAFEPQIILVSAGFDAHLNDPLAQLRLENRDFLELGKRLSALSQQHCEGRLVATLEGGYNLNVVGESVAQFISGLQEQQPRHH